MVTEEALMQKKKQASEEGPCLVSRVCKGLSFLEVLPLTQRGTAEVNRGAAVLKRLRNS